MVVPAGPKALVLDSELACLALFKQIEGQVTQDGKVVGTVVLAQVTFIFTEGDIENPMEMVLDILVMGGQRDGLVGRHREGDDIVADVVLALVR